METNNTTNDTPAPYNPEDASAVPGFASKQGFELAMRQAKALASSTLVPASYQNNVGNTLIALDMAFRIGANPLMVMQNLYVVQGKPSWSSTFLIASINHCGRFTSLRYEEKGTIDGDDYAVRAWANEKATGERLNGTWITWTMVKSEGWLNKSGSKWKTMPDQMFKYRAAAFWQRAYAPEISMGLMTQEEVRDIEPIEVKSIQTSMRFTPKQMEQAKAEIENSATTAEMILERYPNLVAEQVEELKSYTFNLAGV